MPRRLSLVRGAQASAPLMQGEAIGGSWCLVTWIPSFFGDSSSAEFHDVFCADMKRFSGLPSPAGRQGKKQMRSEELWKV